MVAGAHLDPIYGSTIAEVQKSGVTITKLPENESTINSEFSDVPLHISKLIQDVANYLSLNRPDMFVVYADRFESFAALVAASQQGIPVLHIEGGDITEGGCLDDNIRHAMTKLSHLHCTTNLLSYKRVISLGEESWRVCNIGLPSLDHIYNSFFASESELEQELGRNLEPERPIILFTLHSVSSQLGSIQSDIRSCTNALREIQRLTDSLVICTYPNNDTGSRYIIDELKNFSSTSNNVILVPSLGGYNYHGILALSRDPERNILSIGNSSSGVKETACFGCPHINIGDRQKGRLTSSNVFNVPYSTEEIVSTAIKLLKKTTPHNNKLNKVVDPYWHGGASQLFYDFIVKTLQLPQSVILILFEVL